MITGPHPLAATVTGALIFTDASVVAIAAGIKTQTRRLFTPGYPNQWKPDAWKQLQFQHAWVDQGPSPAGNSGPYLKVPYVHPDDADGRPWQDNDRLTVHRVYPRFFAANRIYVKEGWGVAGAWAVDPCLNYRADYSQQPIDPRFMVNVMTSGPKLSRAPMRWHERWRSSVMMPKWAARHFLDITQVRIEHVQDISAADAWAEGVRPASVPSSAGDGTVDAIDPEAETIAEYRTLWDTIHTKPGTTWADNPWVTAYTVQRVTTDGK
jgi:hypothetical protein